MAMSLPTSTPPITVPAVPERISEITARFNPNAKPTTSSSEFASMLSDQLTAQSTSSALAMLGGDDTDSSSTTGSGTNSVLGAGSWMSSLSGLMSSLGTGSSTGGVTGSQVVTDATQYLGVPYKWGGTNPSTGLDCSGLVQRTYADLGITLPRVAADQAKQGTPVASLADAQPGDLIAFGQPVDHIAIYAGNGNIIQAPHTGDVVKLSAIHRPIVAIRRIVGSDDDPTVGAASGLLASATGASSATGTSSAAAAPYQAMFQAAGAKYGIDPQLLSSVAHVESGYNPSARSSAGAVGLMQFMPSTAAGMGFDPTDPAQSIDGAARYLSAQIKQFGSVPLALAAYNAGAGAVKRYGGIPPYPETQHYVSKVLAGIGGVTT